MNLTTMPIVPDFEPQVRKSYSVIFVIKRVAMQLLTEFIGKQKIRLVGFGISRLREKDVRQTLITIFKSIKEVSK